MEPPHRAVAFVPVSLVLVTCGGRTDLVTDATQGAPPSAFVPSCREDCDQADGAETIACGGNLGSVTVTERAAWFFQEGLSEETPLLRASLDPLSAPEQLTVVPFRPIGLQHSSDSLFWISVKHLDPFGCDCVLYTRPLSGEGDDRAIGQVGMSLHVAPNGLLFGGGSRIYFSNLDGSERSVVADRDPDSRECGFGLVDDTFVWLDGGHACNILSVQQPMGGATRHIALGFSAYSVRISPPYVFAVTPFGSPAIHRISLDTEVVETITDSACEAEVGGRWLYWSTADLGALRRVGIGGGPTEEVHAYLPGLVLIHGADERYVYFDERPRPGGPRCLKRRLH